MKVDETGRYWFLVYPIDRDLDPAHVGCEAATRLVFNQHLESMIERLRRGDTDWLPQVVRAADRQTGGNTVLQILNELLAIRRLLLDNPRYRSEIRSAFPNFFHSRRTMIAGTEACSAPCFVLLGATIFGHCQPRPALNHAFSATCARKNLQENGYEPWLAKQIAGVIALGTIFRLLQPYPEGGC